MEAFGTKCTKCTYKLYILFPSALWQFLQHELSHNFAFQNWLLMKIDGNRNIYSAEGRGERRRRPSQPFFENRKCPHFGKKCPDYIHLCVKFSIQNVVLKVSRRKNSNIFHCGAFFLVFLTKCLSKCPNSTKCPLPWKISGCAPA